MKKLLFLIIAMAFIACSVTREINDSNKEIASQFKIKKINWFRNNYIIYAKRNDSLFKIVNDVKDMDVSYRDKIRVGKSYNIDLQKMHPLDSIFGIPVMPNLGVRYVNYIEIEEKCHNALYFAKNLNGLYIENK